MGDIEKELVARRSVRQRQMYRRVSLESDGTERECESRDYTLNTKRALEKKALGCLKDIHIKHVDKSNNHLYEMSTGIYEVYRYSALQYFENVCEHSKINVKHISDKGGSLVETQIRVSHKGSSKHTEQLKYCVNMYHTKSKLMVNGNGVKEYVKDHKKIVKALLSCDNLNDLDRALYSKIHDELLKIGHTEHSKRQRTNAPAGAGQALGSTPSKYPRLPAPGSNQIDPQEDTLVSNDGADRDSSALLCLHCNELMEEDLIECGTCSSWYHYGCENLSRVEFTYHIDNPDVTFECTVCTSLRRDDLVEGLVPPGGCSGSLRDILLDAGECSLSDGGASPADMGRQGAGGLSGDRNDSSTPSLSHTLGLHVVTSNARGINVTDRGLVLGAPTSTGRDTMGANVPFYPTSGLINRVPVSSDYVPCHTGVLGPAMVSGGYLAVDSGVAVCLPCQLCHQHR